MLPKHEFQGYENYVIDKISHLLNGNCKKILKYKENLDSV